MRYRCRLPSWTKADEREARNLQCPRRRAPHRLTQGFRLHARSDPGRCVFRKRQARRQEDCAPSRLDVPQRRRKSPACGRAPRSPAWITSGRSLRSPTSRRRKSRSQATIGASCRSNHRKSMLGSRLIRRAAPSCVRSFPIESGRTTSISGRRNLGWGRRAPCRWHTSRWRAVARA